MLFVQFYSLFQTKILWQFDGIVPLLRCKEFVLYLMSLGLLLINVLHITQKAAVAKDTKLHGFVCVSVYVGDECGDLRWNICISDTHDKHEIEMSKWKNLDIDILLNGGDFSMIGMYQNVVKYSDWIAKSKQEKIIKESVVIAGNNDITLDKEYYTRGTDYSYSASSDSDSNDKKETETENRNDNQIKIKMKIQIQTRKIKQTTIACGVEEVLNTIDISNLGIFGHIGMFFGL